MLRETPPALPGPASRSAVFLTFSGHRSILRLTCNLHSAHSTDNIPQFSGLLRPGSEGSLRDAKEFEHLTLQVGQLRVEDLNDFSSLDQNVALDKAEQPQNLLCGFRKICPPEFRKF